MDVKELVMAPWVGPLIAALIGAAVAVLSPWRDVDGRLIEAAKKKMELAEKLTPASGQKGDPRADELRVSGRADVDRVLARRKRGDLLLRLVCATIFAGCGFVLVSWTLVTGWASEGTFQFWVWTLGVFGSYVGVVVFMASAGRSLMRVRRHAAAKK